MSLKRFDHAAFIAHRSSWQPGDFINPMNYDGRTDGMGDRVVERVVSREVRRVEFMGLNDSVLRYTVEDARGARREIGTSDDPRGADDVQIAWFKTGKLESERQEDL